MSSSLYAKQKNLNKNSIPAVFKSSSNPLLKNLSFYPAAKEYELKSILLGIKNLKIKNLINKNNQTILIYQSPNIKQAKLILELLENLNKKKENYLSTFFIKPLAAFYFEQLKFLKKRQKVYLIGKKDKDFLDFSQVPKKDRIRFVGSAIFNLAYLHELNLALGDVSIDSLFFSKSSKLSNFGLPFQLREISKSSDGFFEFSLFICNLISNSLISFKEVDIFIDHYLSSFSRPDFDKVQKAKEIKEKINFLFNRYYKKPSYYSN
jgi:hypothetical protein